MFVAAWLRTFGFGAGALLDSMKGGQLDRSLCGWLRSWLILGKPELLNYHELQVRDRRVPIGVR